VSEEPPSFLLVPPAGDSEVRRRQAFGRRLHAARRHSGVALEDIARRTKVNPSLLAALEQGDASRWPKGLFRRAFFRDYVAAIGLSPDAHVTEFLQLFPDGEDHSTAVVPAPDVPAALRLTLALETSWALGRDRLRRELVDLTVILALAVAITVSTGISPFAIPAIAALCYVGRAIGVIRRQVGTWRRRSGTRPPSSVTP
jgi:transcriptional regulator with XRE-family HTH domain